MLTKKILSKIKSRSILSRKKSKTIKIKNKTLNKNINLKIKTFFFNFFIFRNISKNIGLFFFRSFYYANIKSFLSFINIRGKHFILSSKGLIQKNFTFSNKFDSSLYSIFYKTVFAIKIIKIKKNKKENFFNKFVKRLGIVKVYLNFTNIFILLTNIKGEIKNWVSAGTGKFIKKRERTTPQVPISLCLRISNKIPKKKIQIVKIQIGGPSKKYKARVIQTLTNRSYVRRYSIHCIEDYYPKAYNGCRLVREKRR
jgi:ribosomal protein S11